MLVSLTVLYTGTGTFYVRVTTLTPLHLPPRATQYSTCNPVSERASATHFQHVQPTFCTCNSLSARATHFLTCNRKYRHGGTLTRYCTLHHPNISSNSPYCTCHPRHLFFHAARTTISILHVLRAAAAQATHKTAGSSLAGAGCALPYDRYESLNCVHGATITG